MPKTIKEILTKIDEWLFDYHIRGCEIADKKSNEICDKNKEQFKSYLHASITELLESLMEKEREITDMVKSDCGTLADVSYDRGFNEAVQEINNKIKEIIGK